MRWSFIVLLFACAGCHSHQIKSKAYAKTGRIPLSDTTLIDGSMHSLISPYKSRLDDQMNRVVCTSKVAMPRVKTEPESLLGNFVSDLCYNRLKKEHAHIDFCLLNFGGLRNALPKGEVSIRDIYQLMPFENQMVIVSISYDSLQSLTHYLAAKQGQPISGATIRIKNQLPDSFTINGAALTASNKKRIFHVLTSDYLAKAGDQMTFFSSPKKLTPLNIKLRDLIIEHCKDQKYINSQLDKRVEILK